DHARRPKLGYTALAAACDPVIVVADRLPAAPQPGDPLALDVHVVSDLRRQLDGCVITAVLAWRGGERTWRWGGDVPADSCVRVGTIELTVPNAPGPLSLHLTLDGPVHATNAYGTSIASGSR